MVFWSVATLIYHIDIAGGYPSKCVSQSPKKAPTHIKHNIM